MTHPHTLTGEELDRLEDALPVENVPIHETDIFITTDDARALLAMARLSLDDGGACTSERTATPQERRAADVAPSAVWNPMDSAPRDVRNVWLRTATPREWDAEFVYGHWDPNEIGDKGDHWWVDLDGDRKGFDGSWGDRHFTGWRYDNPLPATTTPDDRSLDDDGSAPLPADKSSPKPPPPEASPEDWETHCRLLVRWANDDRVSLAERVSMIAAFPVFTPPAPEGDRS